MPSRLSIKLLVQRARSPLSSRRVRLRSILCRKLPPPSAMSRMISPMADNCSDTGLTEVDRKIITMAKIARALIPLSSHTDTSNMDDPRFSRPDIGAEQSYSPPRNPETSAKIGPASARTPKREPIHTTHPGTHRFLSTRLVRTQDMTQNYALFSHNLMHIKTLQIVTPNSTLVPLLSYQRGQTLIPL